MTRRVIFLHTLRSVAEQFDALARELLPEVETWHIVDEMLAKLTVAAGHVPPIVMRRMVEHAAAAEEVGAHALQVTCSSISPAVPMVRPLSEIPVYAIDDAMVSRAVQTGRRTGIAATVPTALDALARLVAERAAGEGRDVAIEKVLCEGAYQYLLRGELPEHDRIVCGYLRELAPGCDVVMVAQASMARAADAMASATATPVLSSPRPAVEYLRDQLVAGVTSPIRRGHLQAN